VFELRSSETSDGVSLLRKMLESGTEDQAATFEICLVFHTRRNKNSLQLINYCVSELNKRLQLYFMFLLPSIGLEF
jgi:hypothetical protein